MKLNNPIITTVAGVLAGGLLAGGGYAIGSAGSTKTITGCVVKASHELLIQNRCARGQTKISWNQQGVPGVAGRTGPQGLPAAAAWARVVPGTSTAIVLDSENLSVQQDGNGVFTLTAGGLCVSGSNPSEVVTPSVGGAASTNGVPVAYVVTPNGPDNVFQVVTGGLSNSGTFTQGHGDSLQRRRVLPPTLGTKGPGSMGVTQSKLSVRHLARSLSIVLLAVGGTGGAIVTPPAVASASTYTVYMCTNGYGGNLFGTAPYSTASDFHSSDNCNRVVEQSVREGGRDIGVVDCAGERGPVRVLDA